MFGYFRFLNQYSDYRTQKVYKNYYCGLCFALDLHYGMLSRMLLSYDVTILAIALHAHKAPCCDKLKCTGCKACKQDYFQNEQWKKIAAVNILLAAEKMSDDIADERSFKAAAGAFFYKSIIKKAQQDYPEIHQAIHEGYRAIQAAEKENCDVLQIGNYFADMMASILEVGFDAPDVTKAYVRQIARWLYFIDALDDYDEDLKKSRFNPIAQADLPFREYVLTQYPQLQQYLQSLYADYDTLAAQLQGNPENEILASILKNSIPTVTSIVLHQQPLPELLHCRSGNEWRAKQ
jgi:hypothetical protein